MIYTRNVQAHQLHVGMTLVSRSTADADDVTFPVTGVRVVPGSRPVEVAYVNLFGLISRTRFGRNAWVKVVS